MSVTPMPYSSQRRVINSFLDFREKEKHRWDWSVYSLCPMSMKCIFSVITGIFVIYTWLALLIIPDLAPRVWAWKLDFPQEVLIWKVSLCCFSYRRNQNVKRTFSGQGKLLESIHPNVTNVSQGSLKSVQHTTLSVRRPSQQIRDRQKVF